VVAAKPIVSVFVHRGPRAPMMVRLAEAIEQKNDEAQQRAELAEEPTQPGLVPCDGCGVLVKPSGDHYGVHFPNGKTSTPCPRSWPPKPVKKP
jgi:hypothetical protein